MQTSINTEGDMQCYGILSFFMYAVDVFETGLSGKSCPGSRSGLLGLIDVYRKCIQMSRNSATHILFYFDLTKNRSLTTGSCSGNGRCFQIFFHPFQKWI